MKQERVWATLDPFVEGGDVLGRKVANASFLTALLDADPFDGYHFFLESESALSAQRAWLAEHHPALHGRGAFRLSLRQNLHTHLAHSRFYVFHLSDCLHRPVALARMRNAFSPHLFPITSLTHSLSYERFMPGYFDQLWGGVSPRDAVIVTSHSARRVLASVFENFRARYGLSEDTFPAPRLEHIPLGVPETATPSDTAVRNMRERLDLDAARQAPLVLTLARISPYSKMDLLPVLAAMRRARELGMPAGTLWVVAGWTEGNDPLPETLTRYAAAMGLHLATVVRPSHEECLALYALADIFLSPSDNIQETFGLTLAEAGYAGLPVIASDFDGYRDIVDHETTGLLIPTLGFAETEETNVLAGIWFDNQYHLKLAQQVVVDVPAMARALARLTGDPALRRRMGEAARARVVALFSWPAILARYLAFWEELAATKISPDKEATLRAAAHPLHMDFARAFAGHFSHTLDDDEATRCILRRTPLGDALYRGVLPPLRYAGMETMLHDDDLRRILLAARKPVSAAELIRMLMDGGNAEGGCINGGKVAGAVVPSERIRRERAAFVVLWAMKQDYLERVE